MKELNLNAISKHRYTYNLILGGYTMSNYLQLRKFNEINLSDTFFDTLKEDYLEFTDWFNRKKDNEAYILEDNGMQGFLYIKSEVGPITDVKPVIQSSKCLKIGTLKINPHGTRLGERFIKKALDHATHDNAEVIYVTIFPKHAYLIELLKKYGFEEHGIKKTHNGEELVLIKHLTTHRDDIYLDYPRFHTNSAEKYLLAIYPDYHTKLFPDSILKNETFDILEDTSHTNSIHKIYICRMKQVQAMNKGDIVIIYRTGDSQGPAEYRSVATSLCIVEEVKCKDSFTNFDSFYNYVKDYSIFTKNELISWYNKNKYLYTIKMTYNAAFKKRLTRSRLINEIGIERETYWGFINLTNIQLQNILEKGEVNESLIID